MLCRIVLLNQDKHIFHLNIFPFCELYVKWLSNFIESRIYNVGLNDVMLRIKIQHHTRHVVDLVVIFEIEL